MTPREQIEKDLLAAAHGVNVHATSTLLKDFQHLWNQTFPDAEEQKVLQQIINAAGSKPKPQVRQMTTMLRIGRLEEDGRYGPQTQNAAKLVIEVSETEKLPSKSAPAEDKPAPAEDKPASGEGKGKTMASLAVWAKKNKKTLLIAGAVGAVLGIFGSRK